MKNHHSIEASIRHAVERSTNVAYVFSGSSRYLLSQMFNSKSRPLYHLCDLIRLNKIDEETYFEILYSRALDRWKTEIDKQVIQEILNLTKCHPYYVNSLCRLLWKNTNKSAMEVVQNSWFNYIYSQTNWISDDLSNLSPNQSNILAGIAHGNVTEPFSQEFSSKVKISASSIRKSLNVLLRDDFVYIEESGRYRVLDPAIETYLYEIKNFDFLEW